MPEISSRNPSFGPSFKAMLLQATGARVPDPPVKASHPSPPRTPPSAPSKLGNQDGSKGTHSTLGDIKLLDAWLDAELEVLDLKEREGQDEANGEALRDAKKRSRMLWRQVLRMWGFYNLLKVKRKPKAKLAQGAPAEQVDQVQPDEQVELDDSQDAEFSSLDEMSDAEFLMAEEPPSKKPRLQVASGSEYELSEHELAEHELSEHEISDSEHSEPAAASASRSRLPTRPGPSFTTHQKDQVRALICAYLGNSPPKEKLKKTAQDVGLTFTQVRIWVSDFYKAHPIPTVEQVLAWRTKCQGSEVSAPLREWLADHQDYPYPSAEELAQLASETGRTTAQLRNWFGDARSRKRLSRTSHTHFSKDHSAILAEAFDKTQFPGKEELQRLAREIGADLKRVENWFTNRRRKQGTPKQKPRLPAEQVASLRAWLHDHMDDPYPSREEREELVRKTGLIHKQVTGWFGVLHEKIKLNTAKKEYEGRCPCCGATNI